MSADNWTVCPKCRRAAQNRRDSFTKKARDGYGKLPEVDYAALLRESQAKIVLSDDLREDYEFYLDENGIFTASYDATCVTCGWKHSFEHEEHVRL